MFRHLTLCNYGAGGSPLPYTLDFATKTFDANWTAPNWSVSGGTAKNTPTVGLGEIIVNGGMEAPYTSGVAANWTELDPDATVTPSEETVDIYAGSSSQRLIRGAGTGRGGIYQNFSAAVGTWYKLAIAHKSAPSGIRATLYDTPNYSGTGFTPSYLFYSASWVLETIIGRATSVNCSVGIGQINTDVLVDGLSLRTMSALIAYRNFPGASNVRVKAPWTIASRYQSGVVARVSADGSQYLLAYHDRTTCYLLKVLTAGTTQLIGITTAYVAGANVEIRTSGDTIQLFCNNAQVGTDQTETTLSTNTRHGLFSTDVSCTVPSIAVEAN